MRPLADAAVCRSESDWLVGINGTRAMTAFNSKTGGFHLTTVGRVQTPTLAILVEREDRIKNFVSKDYWEIHGTFAAKAGEYPGRWFDEKFAKKDGESDLKPERVWDAKLAEAIRAKCLGKPGIVTEESKPTTQMSPLLYDLTSLQREANGRFGFSAKTTLSLAQALYEKHKVLTYPRTDSRALPEDYLDTVKNDARDAGGDQLRHVRRPDSEERVGQAQQAHLQQRQGLGPLRHHPDLARAQAPERAGGEALRHGHQAVPRRVLSGGGVPGDHTHHARGGRAVQDRRQGDDQRGLAGGLWQGSADRRHAHARRRCSRTRRCRPPTSRSSPPRPSRRPRFTEATLLSAMEGAGKLVEDEELREAMREKGLGTPATRAAIIEGLIYEKYVLRQGRELQPTAKAFSLIALLRGLEIPELSSPELTGDWEFKLRRMARGQMKRPDFMKEIADMTREIVAKAKRHESDTVPGDFGTLKVPCPKCGGEIHENYKKFQCQKCEFSLWKIVAGRQLEIPEIEELIAKRQVGPLQGFRSKLGKPFAAVIRLTPELKPEFDFGQDRADRRTARRRRLISRARNRWASARSAAGASSIRR